MTWRVKEKEHLRVIESEWRWKYIEQKRILSSAAPSPVGVQAVGVLFTEGKKKKKKTVWGR